MAIGGAGPLMAAKMAKHLGIKRVIIPPFPGCGGASGLVGDAVRHELMEPLLAEFDGTALEVLRNRLKEMMAKAEPPYPPKRFPRLLSRSSFQSTCGAAGTIGQSPLTCPGKPPFRTLWTASRINTALRFESNMD